MEQTILACDNKGKFLEYIPKMVGHKGIGKRHLAITVLLYNSKGKVLLQKRHHQIFDGMWDLTGATHPLHKEDGSDETVEDATKRCLQVEYGIGDQIELKNLGWFNYAASDGEFSENEHCAMIIGQYEGEVEMNPNVGYEYMWMDHDKFLTDIKQNPQNYSPWAIEGVKILEKTGFFN